MELSECIVCKVLLPKNRLKRTTPEGVQIFENKLGRKIERTSAEVVVSHNEKTHNVVPTFMVCKTCLRSLASKVMTSRVLEDCDEIELEVEPQNQSRKLPTVLGTQKDQGKTSGDINAVTLPKIVCEVKANLKNREFHNECGSWIASRKMSLVNQIHKSGNKEFLTRIACILAQEWDNMKNKEKETFKPLAENPTSGPIVYKEIQAPSQVNNSHQTSSPALATSANQTLAELSKPSTTNATVSVPVNTVIHTAQPVIPDKTRRKPNTDIPSPCLLSVEIVGQKRSKKSDGHIPRPMNAFMLYAKELRPKLCQQNPGVPNGIVSKLIAQHWRALLPEQKKAYHDKSAEVAKQHSIDHPGYTFQPKSRKKRIYNIAVGGYAQDMTQWTPSGSKLSKRNHMIVAPNQQSIMQQVSPMQVVAVQSINQDTFNQIDNRHMSPDGVLQINDTEDSDDDLTDISEAETMQTTTSSTPWPVGPIIKASQVTANDGEKSHAPSTSHDDIMCTYIAEDVGMKRKRKNMVTTKNAFIITSPKPKSRIKRPLNAFMIFSGKERKKVKQRSEYCKLSSAELSRAISQKWHSLTDEGKRPFYQESKLLYEKHMKEHPDYTYNPGPELRMRMMLEAEGKTPTSKPTESDLQEAKSREEILPTLFGKYYANNGVSN